MKSKVNERNRPFADQVLEYAGVQVGDIWSDTTSMSFKVLYIGNTDSSFPVLVVESDLETTTFVNEEYITGKCTLVERDGQEVIEESNLVIDSDGATCEIIYEEGKYIVTREWDDDTGVFTIQVHHHDWDSLVQYNAT